MQTVKVKASTGYEIHIGSGLLSAPPASFFDIISHRKIMIVSDDNVFPLYGERLKKLLTENGNQTECFVFAHGEGSKNLMTYQSLTEKMYSAEMCRSDLVIALGGGVVGDLSGFAAATYQRGIDYIQFPTTLLAAVDSSVGGKTGLDLTEGKNQIGAFHQPVQVICDVDLLKTLPKEEYQNGCAEIIKYGMISSKKLLDSIKSKPVNEQYEDVIFTCVSMKRDLVEQDEFDRGMRMLLNFGHTTGHAVEALSEYSVPHGKGVAIGMAVITDAAAEFGVCTKADADALKELLKMYELPFGTDYPAEALADAIMRDKKRQGDKITLVVPENAGKCILKEISKNDVPMWLKAGGIK